MNQGIHSAAGIYLDISRLLSAGRRRTPSGIERVEFAYAKYFSAAAGTRYVGGFLGGLHFLPPYLALAYIQSLETAWNGSPAGRIKTITLMGFMYLVLLVKVFGGLLPRKSRAMQGSFVYLNLSHENLTARDALLRFKSRTGARLLVFVHDLIPITHPEYGRPGQARMHRRRMDNVGALADAVLVNSAATKDDFCRYFGDAAHIPEVHVVHLGVPPAASGIEQVSEADPATPYFLMLATLEPRKNHLLLLNLWRSLAGESAVPPRLIIAGRRGWENEMVLDMLERCEAIAGIVEERRDLPDAELSQLMRGARALLLPSFAEGFGLPVAEALAAGTPVICSDLPALREIGGDVPEYIDPLDGLAWRRAILDYAPASSRRRAAQCERLGTWSAPRWDLHFAQVSAILAGLV